MPFICIIVYEFLRYSCIAMSSPLFADLHSIGCVAEGWEFKEQREGGVAADCFNTSLQQANSAWSPMLQMLQFGMRVLKPTWFRCHCIVTHSHLNSVLLESMQVL